MQRTERGSLMRDWIIETAGIGALVLFSVPVALALVVIVPPLVVIGAIGRWAYHLWMPPEPPTDDYDMQVSNAAAA